MVYVYVYVYVYIYLGIEVLQDLLNAEFPSAGATDGDATWKSAKSKVHHAIPRFHICMLVLELTKSQRIVSFMIPMKYIYIYLYYDISYKIST